MSDEIVIRCCAPTLAAIKTGSLFSCAFGSREEMTDSLRAINRCLISKGMCIFFVLLNNTTNMFKLQYIIFPLEKWSYM